MAPSIVDQLSFYHSIGIGLMSRMEYIGNNWKLNKEYGQYLKYFHKCFPSDTAGIEKVPNIQALRKDCKKICDQLHDLYHTMLDIMDFQKQALHLLRGTLKDMGGIQFDTHHELVEDILLLFNRYFQVPIIWNKQQIDFKGCVLMYNHCYVTMQPEDEMHIQKYNNLASYLLKYSSDTIAMIQTDFQNEEKTGEAIGQLILSMLPIYTQYRDTAHIRNMGSFDPDLMYAGNLMSQPVYRDIPYVAKIRQWTIYASICCPKLCLNPEFLSFLESIGQESYAISIFRSHSINFLDILTDIFGATNGFEAPTLDPKIKNEVSKVAIVNAGLFHRENRVYIKWILLNLKKLFRLNPNYIAPCFPMLLAAMCMAKEELIWYYTHAITDLPRISKSKYHHASSYDGIYVPEILSLMDALHDTMKTGSEVVELYYKSVLADVEANKMQELVEEYLIDPSMDPRVQEIFISIPAKLRFTDVGYCKNLVSVRRNWTRAMVYFLCSNISMNKEISDRMNTVAYFSRFVDGYQEILQQHVELHELYWYRNLVDIELQERAKQGEICHFLHSIKIADSYSNFVHSYCMEDEKEISRTLPLYIESMMNKLGHQVDALINSYFLAELDVEEDISPIQAAHKLQRQQEIKQKIDKKHSAALASMQWPTLSEHAIHLRMLGERVLHQKQLLAEFTDSIKIMKILSVYNVTLSIKNVIQNRVLEQVQEFIRKQAKLHIDKPRKIFQALESFANMLNEVSQMLPGWNLHTIVSQVLIKESGDELGNLFGTSILPMEPPSRLQFNKTFLQAATIWLLDTLESLLPKTGNLSTCISDTAKAIYTMPIKGTPEMIYDKDEALALCLIIGTRGFHTLSAILLHYCAKRTVEVLEIAKKHKETFLLLSRQYKDSECVLNVVKNTLPLNEICEKLVAIGSALTIRKWLKESIATVCDHHVPFISSVLYDAQRMLQQLNQKLPTLENAVHDFGFEHDDVIDSALEHILREQSANQPSDVFEILPWVFAASLGGSIWHKAMYISSLNIYDNNAHMIATASYALTSVFRPQPTKVDTGIPNSVSEDLSASLRFLLHVTSTVALHLIVDTKSAASGTTSPSNSVLFFIIKLVSMISNPEHVDQRFVEQCCPHALLHGWYVTACMEKCNSSEPALSKLLAGSTSHDKMDLSVRHTDKTS